MPKEILLISPPLRARDGISAHSINLLRGWLSLGYVVQVAHPDIFSIKNEVQLRSEGELNEYLLSGIKIHPMDRQPDHFEQVVIQYAISSYWLQTFLINHWLKKLSAKKRILLCHEPSRELALLGKFGQLIYGEAIKFSTKVCTFSQLGSEALSKFTTHPISMVPLSVPSLADSPGSGGEVPHLLLFGYYLEEKGFEVGLAAVVDALRKAPNSLHLELVVSPRQRLGSARIFAFRDRRAYAKFSQKVREAADQFPTQIVIHGYLTDRELTELLNRTDFILLPYQAITNSGVAVTSKAHGVPVISSPLSPLRQALQDSAIFAGGMDAASWSAELINLTSDLQWRKIRNSLASKAIRSRSQESASKIAAKIIE